MFIVLSESQCKLLKESINSKKKYICAASVTQNLQNRLKWTYPFLPNVVTTFMHCP